MIEKKPFQFKFFLPDSRLLEEAEIASLHAKLGQSAPARDEKGLWIEMTCPDQSCLDDQGRLTLPVEGDVPERGQGILLNLFCPEGRCEILQSTDIP
jgi:hypothetical protein